MVKYVSELKVEWWEKKIPDLKRRCCCRCCHCCRRCCCCHSCFCCCCSCCCCCCCYCCRCCCSCCRFCCCLNNLKTLKQKAGCVSKNAWKDTLWQIASQLQSWTRLPSITYLALCFPTCTEVAFSLLTQRLRVRIPCLLKPILEVLKGFRECSKQRRPAFSTT